MIEQIFMTFFVLFTVALVVAIIYVILRSKRNMNEMPIPAPASAPVAKTKKPAKLKTDPAVEVLKKNKKIPYNSDLKVPQLNNGSSFPIGHVATVFIVSSVCLWLAVTFMAKSNLLETAFGVEAMAFMITMLDALMIIRRNK